MSVFRIFILKKIMRKRRVRMKSEFWFKKRDIDQIQLAYSGIRVEISKPREREAVSCVSGSFSTASLETVG